MYAWLRVMCAVVMTGSSTRSPECITAVMLVPSWAARRAGVSSVAADRAALRAAEVGRPRGVVRGVSNVI